MALALPLALCWCAGPRGRSVRSARSTCCAPSRAWLCWSSPCRCSAPASCRPSIALTLYGLPAILINTYTALREVDPDIVEAGPRPGHDRAPADAPHQAAARPAGDLRRHPHRRGADRVGRDARGLHRRRRAGRADHRRHGHAQHAAARAGRPRGRGAGGRDRDLLSRSPSAACGAAVGPRHDPPGERQQDLSRRGPARPSTGSISTCPTARPAC